MAFLGRRKALSMSQTMPPHVRRLTATGPKRLIATGFPFVQPPPKRMSAEFNKTTDSPILTPGE
jgi:hypothetical protein